MTSYGNPALKMLFQTTIRGKGMGRRRGKVAIAQIAAFLPIHTIDLIGLDFPSPGVLVEQQNFVGSKSNTLLALKAEAAHWWTWCHRRFHGFHVAALPRIAWGFCCHRTACFRILAAIRSIASFGLPRLLRLLRSRPPACNESTTCKRRRSGHDSCEMDLMLLLVATRAAACSAAHDFFRNDDAGRQT